MLFRPLLATDLSGSLGGIVASHNRGGPYLRNRSIPVNPNTPQQQAVRGFLASLTSLWGDTLTPTQRDDWDTYALNVPIPNAIGEPRNIGGLPMYIRSNVPRLPVSLPRVDDAPIIFNLGDFSNPSVDSFVASAETFNLNFTAADDWANEDDAAMLLSTSRPQNPSINFFKGPYRSTDAILGNLSTPPTSPVVTLASFAFGEGQRVFVQARVTRADGRLSLPFRAFGLGA